MQAAQVRFVRCVGCGVGIALHATEYHYLSGNSMMLWVMMMRAGGGGG